ncbi:intracellular sulfur oxidation DsrE/DsrF family protein [Algoriphagus boseongensis]|uniref:Intracellular sulfur oxidation DsrE/DsrF family protein n=1 Tax=Algoriphagus boseongensis TaxID=1442587 RepID=A0A4R6T9I0_9BACT|nr:DsrE family protein [Algoriphagus boseongensis]TDQ17537.1 intracellular sulfur oxidation DsrE/DsrF family protein [Algoriphagus boseongensis]
MKLILSFAIILFSGIQAFAQGDMPPHIKDKMTYPVLDFHPWVGVIPVENPALPYDPTLEYQVAIDLYGRVKDSTAIHPIILEVARTYNLGIANGVPKEKLKIAGVFHGGITPAIFTDEEYQKKYGIPNPNLPALAKLKEVGVEFYVCAQSMTFWNYSKDQITPMVSQAMSAKYAFITLDQKGYSYLDVSGD